MERLATKRDRYQAGSLETSDTEHGLCWYLRLRKKDELGKTIARPRFRIGLVRDLPTRSAAKRASEDLRRSFNEPASPLSVTRRFGELIDRYTREEMPPRYATAKAYRNLLEKHIRPRWGEELVQDVKPRFVRDWLRSLPLSTKTRGHVRDMLRTLFRYAMLWEWLPATENPMSLFRLERSSMRTKVPRVITTTEFLMLIGHIQREPHKTMVTLAACLGLRCSELVGLQWRDVDWQQRTVLIRRAVVENRVDTVKTEHSRRPLPLHASLAQMLLDLRKASDYREETDWIFASPAAGGIKPFLPGRMLARTIKPAAAAAGLGTEIGWHTFRHSYRAWLDQAGAPIGVQRDLLRHADVATTMNVYGGSFVDSLREANDSVIRRVIQ